MDKNLYIDFGKRLQQLRAGKNLLQNEIASQLGIAQTTYSGYEKGARKIPLEYIQQLAVILEVSPTYLIMGTHPKSQLNPNTLSNQELDHIKKYRTLDQTGKHTVTAILNVEFERCEMVPLRMVGRDGSQITRQVNRKETDNILKELENLPPKNDF